MENIIELIISNVSFAILYSIVTTFVIIVMIITQKIRKKKYVDWKKDSLNLYIYKREWERNDDELVNDLFSENERLFNENKVLKQDITKASILSLILLIFIVLFSKFKKEKNTLTD